MKTETTRPNPSYIQSLIKSGKIRLRQDDKPASAYDRKVYEARRDRFYKQGLTALGRRRKKPYGIPPGMTEKQLRERRRLETLNWANRRRGNPVVALPYLYP